MEKIFTYKDLIVWQKSVKLAIEVYKVTENLPKSELYGLTSQMRRAAISIPSNIAEGRRRFGQKEFKRFLSIAYGSGAELETQIIILKELSFGKDLNLLKCEDLLSEVMKMLNKIFTTLNS